MNNLKLLSQLQGNETATLLLKKKTLGELEYFILGYSINYSIIVSGTCAGEIKNDLTSYNVLLTSITPLLDKGYTFHLNCSDGNLCFLTEDEKLRVVPLFVEYNDTRAADVIERFLRFSDAINDIDRQAHQSQELEQELQELESRHRSVSIMNLSGGPSDNPFGENESTNKIDQKYLPRIEELRTKIADVKERAGTTKELHLAGLTQISGAASRNHEVVEMCDTYAMMSLKTCYLLQKTECPAQSIQGTLLDRLLRASGGENFYYFEDAMVYSAGNETGRTTVFIEKYLPNTVIDSTIVTRGTVQEKYVLNIKGLLPVLGALQSSFPTMEFDMGEAVVKLTNEKGESMTHRFEVEDAKTLALNKMMRGDDTVKDISMATINVPREVQKLLPLFKENLTIFVKKNKFIFQSDTLYLVFGR